MAHTALIAAAKDEAMLATAHNSPQRTIIANTTNVDLTPAMLLDRRPNRSKRKVVRLITTQAITITAAWISNRKDSRLYSGGRMHAHMR
jgi:hypothetical protein